MRGADDIRIIGTATRYSSETTPITKSKPVPANGAMTPLKPVRSNNGNPGAGWVKKVLGEVSFYVPSSWNKVGDVSGNQGAWCIGNESEPEAGFGLIRDDVGAKIPGDVVIQAQGSVTVGGYPAKTLIGKSPHENVIGWLITVQKMGPDGKQIYFIGAAKVELWPRNKPLLEKILGTVKFSK